MMLLDTMNRIARFFDAEYADYMEDLPALQAYAQRTGGPLLELGCGTGRLLIPLAQAGYQVTGVDLSDAMLDLARAKIAAAGMADRVTLMQGDYASAPLGGPYQLAFCVMNTFLHLLTTDEQLAALRHWRRHLAPRGLLLLDLFQPVVKILEQNDILLGIENEASTFIGTGSRLAEFLDDLDSEYVGAIWDPCNVLYDAEDPETPYPDGYEAIKPRIIHVHIKDSKPNAKGEQECCPIGEGDIDYDGQFAALLEDEYDGWVSLETHWRPVALSKEQVDKPGGADYSSGAEQASVICLGNMQRIIEKVNSRP